MRSSQRFHGPVDPGWHTNSSAVARYQFNRWLELLLRRIADVIVGSSISSYGIGFWLWSILSLRDRTAEVSVRDWPNTERTGSTHDLTSSPGAEKPGVPHGVRVYVIGDVHGRADLLASILARVDRDLERHPIDNPLQVFLGDYIDRGPYSRDVIDLLIARRKRWPTVCLKGNHEAMALRVLENSLLLPRWLKLGGGDTMASYGITPPTSADSGDADVLVHSLRTAMPEDHKKFLRGLPLSLTCGDFFLSHAGARPGIPLWLQPERDLLWIRDEFLQYAGDLGKVVIHGHTPVGQPEIFSNRINVDTGAYATGRLTCLILEADQLDFL
jgi:Calcineurin-like phosphoesterase